VIMMAKRGRPKTIDHGKVALAVWHRIMAGDQRKRAYDHAAKEFGVSYNSAEKAFAKWKKLFRGLNAWGFGPNVLKKFVDD
jgi:hypothetical protein